MKKSTAHLNQRSSHHTASATFGPFLEVLGLVLLSTPETCSELYRCVSSRWISAAVRVARRSRLIDHITKTEKTKFSVSLLRSDAYLSHPALDARWLGFGNSSRGAGSLGLVRRHHRKGLRRVRKEGGHRMHTLVWCWNSRMDHGLLGGSDIILSVHLDQPSPAVARHSFALEYLGSAAHHS